MEMTVFVAALGIATLWIVGEARGERYRMGRTITTIVVMCVAGLEVYNADLAYFRTHLVTTGVLLTEYCLLLLITRNQTCEPLRTNSAGIVFLPSKSPQDLEEQHRERIVVGQSRRLERSMLTNG